MKKYKITEEQIKKLSQQDQIVEEHLQEWFPEAFKPKLEIGAWYKVIGYLCGQTPGSDILACYTGSKNENYGFTFKGFWETDLTLYHEDLAFCTFKASEEEVKTALVKEAEKRGYKQGTKIKALISEHIPTYTLRQGRPIFSLDDNKMYIGGVLVFKAGIWAEIIEQGPIVLSRQEIANKLGIDQDQIDSLTVIRGKDNKIEYLQFIPQKQKL